MAGFGVELLGGATNISGQATSIHTQESRINNPIEIKSPAGAEGGEKPVTFAELLNEKLSESSELIKDANKVAEEIVAGRNKDLHGAMIAMEKADVSFRTLMQIRNKMLDAYREIMRMQV